MMKVKFLFILMCGAMMSPLDQEANDSNILDIRTATMRNMGQADTLANLAYIIDREMRKMPDIYQSLYRGLRSNIIQTGLFLAVQYQAEQSRMMTLMQQSIEYQKIQEAYNLDAFIVSQIDMSFFTHSAQSEVLGDTSRFDNLSSIDVLTAILEKGDYSQVGYFVYKYIDMIMPVRR